MSENYNFSTLAVHAGQKSDPTTGACATPIYQTASFEFNNTEHAANLFNLQEFGNIYSRLTNPTNAVLEARVAALEGGVAALAVSSGHAAQFTVFHTLLEPGDEILAANKLYGGSITQMGTSFRKFGWTATFVEPTAENFKAALNDNVKAIFIESLANPGGVVTDIAAIAKVAHDAGIVLVVDNTLASPYLCRPLEHGADIVVHSLTKFLGGQGNSIGGIVVDGGSFDWRASDKYKSLTDPCPSYHGVVLAETFGPAMGNIAFAIACRVLSLRDIGQCLSPQNAFYILNGIETLPLRMQRHCENALAVATFLNDHDNVAWVSYSGLEGDAYHDLQQKYMPKGGGAVMTFGLKGGYDAGVKMVESVQLFKHLANIGDTRSLIIHPSSTTHRQLDEAGQIAAGAGPDVIRLSIGIEDIKDILADLDQALKA
ncbi:O-acetylhomoserine aminocarboxypropyltransferase [Paremcibacter congregatus]|uniref:O-acetylhomoserine aminocarboxypropyltransferase n=1 Tax=Paremcibacter congregatus TaxID=2043170 RepID=A0A2G4YLV1_9PROT|nr:O-acetylhomoserine aminocarboxypropyltransferase [Paremcibacter congregatus]PHZ83305.1 O-acetylhomoserine aminocarboxypropyltransferase [Paremcibacter congregatus]QDE28221.1 O-acetylhomoserine aminocarboxypropyltransferase [Paremcibacter congregatus]